MQVRILCPFRLTSSHEINTVGFLGCNKVELEVPFFIENILGDTGTDLRVDKDNTGQLYAEILSNTLYHELEQIEALKRVSAYLSFLINQKELNPSYGTVYVDFIWYNFKATVIHQDNNDFIHESMGISDALITSSMRKVVIGNKGAPEIAYHEVLDFYFDGLRSGHSKSKYLHWFLILEHTEKTYSKMFPQEKLFNNEDKEVLLKVTGRMGCKRKQNAIKGMFDRTKKGRAEKLFQMLKKFEIVSVDYRGQSEPVSEKMINEIIDTRNKLAHASQKPFEDVLWYKLFPIVTQLVDKILEDEACLQ